MLKQKPVTAISVAFILGAGHVAAADSSPFPSSSPEIDGTFTGKGSHGTRPARDYNATTFPSAGDEFASLHDEELLYSQGAVTHVDTSGNPSRAQRSDSSSFPSGAREFSSLQA